MDAEHIKEILTDVLKDADLPDLSAFSKTEIIQLTNQALRDAEN
ncbi:hypothetical protein [Brucella thiophenivorans]|uniref:Uncharacterized protein n=1 Tax=Brucella thiophenivorans TaxID=571255 RepID=A0A256FU12_9HYPH|nr:hypothetical protein [Brucella thiophenivorans]OYR18228.1 hypothetical protein CEV31_4240 [Brucella thiophenivorans]